MQFLAQWTYIWEVLLEGGLGSKACVAIPHTHLGIQHPQQWELHAAYVFIGLPMGCPGQRTNAFRQTALDLKAKPPRGQPPFHVEPIRKNKPYKHTVHKHKQ
eukprot:11757054-Heterocapsa_arctica.AAC.1